MYDYNYKISRIKYFFLDKWWRFRCLFQNPSCTCVLSGEPTWKKEPPWCELCENWNKKDV